jgi:hypothetical protein
MNQVSQCSSATCLPVTPPSTDKESNQVQFLITGENDEILLLEENKQLMAKIAKELKALYRYEGGFSFFDIPF